MHAALDGAENSAGTVRMKLHVFQIAPNAQKTRLLALAKRMLPEVPEYVLREAFQKRDVKVNGHRVGMDSMAVPGAEIKIYTRDLEAKIPTVEIIYEDEKVLVVFKPAGISCEADAKGGKTLPQLIAEQKKDLTNEPLLCHRLDNPTEGLILLAKTPDVQILLQEAFRKRQIYKEYTCVVLGTPDPVHAVLDHFLIKDAKRAKVRVTPHEGREAKQIITEYTVLEKGECARLKVKLHTGRTHQIRAHLAFIGHPLLGDDQYGDREANRHYKVRRLMLCSTSISFKITGELEYLNDLNFTCRPTF